MVDQNLLTVFLAVTAVAVLIQTGILVGFYVVTAKLTRQADQAMDTVHKLLGPLESAVENLHAVTSHIAEFSNSAQGQIRQVEKWFKRTA
jgi:hypothetical protein